MGKEGSPGSKCCQQAWWGFSPLSYNPSYIASPTHACWKCMRTVGRRKHPKSSLDKGRVTLFQVLSTSLVRFLTTFIQPFLHWMIWDDYSQYMENKKCSKPPTSDNPTRMCLPVGTSNHVMILISWPWYSMITSYGGFLKASPSPKPWVSILNGLMWVMTGGSPILRQLHMPFVTSCYC